MLDLQAGNLVKVISNSHPEELIVLITHDAQSMCNSDGEEWWRQWRGKNVKTDKAFIVSSRYHKFEIIN